jgi:hypothetical protein
MGLTPDKPRWAVPDHVVTREVAGTLVLLDVNSGRSFTLDAIGIRVWRLLQATGSFEATCRALEADYAAAADDDIRRDVRSMIEHLVSGGLLVASA